MNIFAQNHEFFSQPIRLTESQKTTPLKVIHDFFTDIHLVESRMYLADLLQCALTKSNSEFAEAKQRDMIWTFAERLEELIEAAYILHSKNKKL